MDGHDMSMCVCVGRRAVEMKLPILLFQLRNVALSCMMDGVLGVFVALVALGLCCTDRSLFLIRRGWRFLKLTKSLGKTDKRDLSVNGWQPEKRKSVTRIRIYEPFFRLIQRFASYNKSYTVSFFSVTDLIKEAFIVLRSRSMWN